MSAPESSSGPAPGGAPRRAPPQIPVAPPARVVQLPPRVALDARTAAVPDPVVLQQVDPARVEQSLGGASGGGAGLQAATQSLGGSVAQGAKNTDGKDVLGS